MAHFSFCLSVESKGDFYILKNTKIVICIKNAYLSGGRMSISSQMWNISVDDSVVEWRWTSNAQRQASAPAPSLSPPYSLTTSVTMVKTCCFVRLPWEPHVTSLSLVSYCVSARSFVCLPETKKKQNKKTLASPGDPPEGVPSVVTCSGIHNAVWVDGWNTREAAAWLSHPDMA